MIQVSNSFKNAMKAPVKVVSAQIAVQDGATYTSGGDLVKAEVQSSGYFFGVATKTLTFVLLGTSHSLLEKHANVVLKVQTDADNDTWESCDLGDFKIVEQTVDLEKDMTTFKAYDAIGIAGLKPYATGGLNFPTTVNQLAVQLASASDMSYDEESLANGTYNITEDLYSNISNLTYRDILAEVAGASASLASVSGVGSDLSFRTPSTTPLETLTYSNLESFKLEPHYGDVNAVVLSRTPQEDNVVVYPYSEVAGETFKLDDVGESIKELKKFSGRTQQKIFSGKNLLNTHATPASDTLSAAGISYTLKDDGTITTSGTSTSTYKNIRFDVVLPAGTYKFSGCPSGGNINGYSFCIQIGSGSSATYYYDYGSGNQFTLSAQTTVMAYPVRLGGGTGTVMNNKTFKPMITVSTASQDYEQYPVYPQRIRSVSGLHYVKVCNGKNLAEVKEGTHSYNSNQTWTIANGVITTTRPDSSVSGGCLNISNGAATVWATAEDEHLTPNGGNYTLTVRKSGTITAASNGYTRITAYIYRDGAMTSHRNVYSNITNDTTTIAISLAADEHVGCILNYSQYVSFTNLELRVQLEAGSSSTAFTPYDGKRYELNLITGKNLIDASKFGTMTANGLTLKSTADGTIRITGTSTASGHFSIPFKIPSSYVNQTAVFSVTGTWGNLSDIGVKSGTQADGFTVSQATHVVNTLTQSRLENATTLDIWYQQDREISAEIKFQFEISSTKTAWEKFSSIELNEIGESSDYIFPSGGDWYLHAANMKQYYDGTENWYASGAPVNTGVKAYYHTIGAEAHDWKTGFSNLGRVIGSDEWSTVAGKNPGNVGITSNNSYLKIAASDAADVAGLKAYLAKTPMVLFFPLDTPTNTKITNTSLVSQLNALSSAALYGEGTVITALLGDIVPFLTIDYYRNRDNLCSVKLANNEILDDNREALGEPIFEAVDGFGFSPFTATTEGHGWYEVGDCLLLGERAPNGLPSEYQEVKYLQKTTTAMSSCVRTGVVPDTTTELEIEFSVDELGTYNGISGATITGDGGMSIRFLYAPSGTTYDLTNTDIYIRNLSTSSLTINHFDLTQRHTVGLKTDGIYIDGVRKSTSRGTTSIPCDILLFSVNRNDSGGSAYTAAWSNTKDKIYRAKIWKGGSLVRDMIPCVRRSDNAPGFYDLVGGTFYGNLNANGGLVAGDQVVSTVIITDIKLTIDGGIKETLKGVAPDETTTNYALAGGIKKSIYNTEIKVDKQGQEITSIVSRQDEFEGQTLANFSQISQNINSVVTTIQTTGGGNLIHNSVGYKKNTDGTLASWTNSGTVDSETSPESVSYGALSGNQIDLGASSYITQEIPVDLTGSVYTLTFRAKKGATGTAKVSFYPKSSSSPSTDGFSVEMPNGTAVLWQEYSITSMTPLDTPMIVKVETNNAVTEFAITDLMLTVGDSRTPWVSASDEIMSKSVAIDSEGVKVNSNTSNDYVKLDELGLNGYSDAGGSLQNVFTINRDLTEVEKLKSRRQIEMPPLKIVPISSGSNSGWGWVKV